MLVVMLILLTVTALAGVSFQASQFDLRSAGNNRSALQTQYVSEAAMATTISWVDATSLDRSIMSHITNWNLQDPPEMNWFAEPALTAGNRADANRTQWMQQVHLTKNVKMPPITLANEANDPVGTFGPRVPLHPGTQERLSTAKENVSDYVVDMYDCRRLTGVGSPGSQVNQGGSGTIKEMQLFCVLTSRGRSFTWGGQDKNWFAADGKTKIPMNRFTMAHDTRGTIVSPPIVVQ
ncbi:MAG TPA: hypothetical protein VJV78_42300 [Polyangiales bacterium]|nr:hypothetical protein [Polyangiales bacterium]